MPIAKFALTVTGISGGMGMALAKLSVADPLMPPVPPPPQCSGDDPVGELPLGFD